MHQLTGRAITLWGPNLEHEIETVAGDFFYVPANIPHWGFNPYDEPAVAVVARTDPQDQENLVVCGDNLIPEGFKAMAAELRVLERRSLTTSTGIDGDRARPHRRAGPSRHLGQAHRRQRHSRSACVAPITK